jgi:GxxExxY protein
MHGTNHQIDHLAAEIVDSAFAVHSRLGPGLLESVYEVCLAHELRRRGLKVECQVALPVIYDEVRLDAARNARKVTLSALRN